MLLPERLKNRMVARGRSWAKRETLQITPVNLYVIKANVRIPG